MLKAVDVMYFVYYTDMDIPFLTYVNYMLFFPDVYGRSDFSDTEIFKRYIINPYRLQRTDL